MSNSPVRISKVKQLPANLNPAVIYLVGDETSQTFTLASTSKNGDIFKLQGDAAKDAYDSAVSDGFAGSLTDWFSQIGKEADVSFTPTADIDADTLEGAINENRSELQARVDANDNGVDLVLLFENQLL